MADLQKVVYLSSAQYQTLISNGTVTVDGVTVTYSANDLYITPLEGIPAGGTAGQYLKKNSSTDFDTSWASLSTSPTSGSSAPITSDAVYTALLDRGYNLVKLWGQTVTKGMEMNPTTISMSERADNYAYFFVEVLNWSGAGETNPPDSYLRRFFCILPRNQYCVISGSINFSNQLHFGTRYIGINNDGTVNIEACMGREPNNSFRNHNDWMIPFNIYGVKV